MSPELRKLFDDERLARQRFTEQVEGRAQRTWSDGRLGAADDGDLAFTIGGHPDRELVIVDFGKPVESIAVSPQQAIELAQSLIKHARAVAKQPLSIRLH